MDVNRAFNHVSRNSLLRNIDTIRADVYLVQSLSCRKGVSVLQWWVISAAQWT